MIFAPKLSKDKFCRLVLVDWDRLYSSARNIFVSFDEPIISRGGN